MTSSHEVIGAFPGAWRFRSGAGSFPRDRSNSVTVAKNSKGLTMFANQRQSLLGGESSPSFSSEDAFRAAGMGIALSPADVLAAKRAVVERVMEPTEVMLATLRGQAEARIKAEKRITELLQQQYKLRLELNRRQRFEWLALWWLVAETAIILWMVWRLWIQ